MAGSAPKRQEGRVDQARSPLAAASRAPGARPSGPWPQATAGKPPAGGRPGGTSAEAGGDGPGAPGTPSAQRRPRPPQARPQPSSQGGEAPEAHPSPPPFSSWEDPSVIAAFAENATVRVESGPDDGQRIVHIESDAGKGTMSSYDLFPGVALICHDFRMTECVTSFACAGNFLNVIYCREGRLEHPSPEGEHLFTARGDVKIDDYRGHAGRYVLPLERYLDVSFSFDIDVCEDVISQTFGGFPVSVRSLRDRFCRDDTPYVLRGLPQLEQVFSGLDTVDPSIRKPYAQVKALELLLLLSQTECSGSSHSLTYFRHALVQKVKEARGIMVEDLGANYTIEELARRVDVPVTTFKNCFKGVYGSPPHTYLRSRRMEHAALMLSTTQDTVTSIGMAVGYDSPSKFSAAFRQVMGMTPTQYRRRAGG